MVSLVGNLHLNAGVKNTLVKNEPKEFSLKGFHRNAAFSKTARI